MDLPIYIENKFHMFEKSILLYIFSKQRPSYVIEGGKTVILVKCPFHHNTSPVRSKNWRGGRGGNTTIYERLSLIATHNEIFSSSKLHISLTDRIIIGLKEGQNFRFKKNLRNMRYQALITLESNPRHALSTYQFI